MSKKISTKTKVLLIVPSVIVLLIAAVWIISISIYNSIFKKRCESYGPQMLRVEDFEGLERTRYHFVSDKGQMLTGYLYSACEDPDAIIVFAHGYGGGGHNSYMNCIDFFAQNGFLVFAYDATGNDESQGQGAGGVPQGVIDLDHAISFVENSGYFPKLPVCLFGHSWGGYSVSAVLTYHPEVKAVIECCGPNSSADLVESGGLTMVGPAVYVMMPFVRLHEYINYGKYATNTAMDGFANSDARVMVVHSADDNTIRIRYGYDIYYEKYKDDPRFEFIRFESRGHNSIFLEPDNNYSDEFNAEYSHRIDEELFAGFVDFYYESL